MPVIRTDFFDQATWEAVRAALVAPSADGFVAAVDFVDDPVFSGATAELLLDLATEDVGSPALPARRRPGPGGLVRLTGARHRSSGRSRPGVPRAAVRGREQPVDLHRGFAEFADNVEPDGVFRGF